MSAVSWVDDSEEPVSLEVMAVSVTAGASSGRPADAGSCTGAAAVGSVAARGAAGTVLTASETGAAAGAARGIPATKAS